MNWQYNEREDRHEKHDGALLLVVWKSDFGWEWLVYNQQWDIIGDSLVEARDGRHKPHYASKRAAQRAIERWVKRRGKRQRDGQSET